MVGLFCPQSPFKVIVNELEPTLEAEGDGPLATELTGLPLTLGRSAAALARPKYRNMEDSLRAFILKQGR